MINKLVKLLTGKSLTEYKKINHKYNILIRYITISLEKKNEITNTEIMPLLRALEPSKGKHEAKK